MQFPVATQKTSHFLTESTRMRTMENLIKSHKSFSSTINQFAIVALISSEHYFLEQSKHFFQLLAGFCNQRNCSKYVSVFECLLFLPLSLLLNHCSATHSFNFSKISLVVTKSLQFENKQLKFVYKHGSKQV